MTRYAGAKLQVAEPPRLKLANSLAQASVGEVVLLDKDGGVVKPKPLAWYEARAWMLAGSIAGLGGAALALAGLPVLVGGAFIASCLGFFAWDRRQLRELHSAVALASAGRRDEAWTAFQEITKKRFNPALQAQVELVMASLAWQRGDLADATHRYQRVADATRNQRTSRQTYWLAEFATAQLLAIRGELDKAKRLRVHLETAPRGDYFAWTRIVTDLAIAFHAGTTDDLPADLHDWAKITLEMNRSGYAAAALAWAFAERDEAEMARLLMNEAPARLEAAFLQETDPKLAAWLERQLDRSRNVVDAELL